MTKLTHGVDAKYFDYTNITINNQFEKQIHFLPCASCYSSFLLPPETSSANEKPAVISSIGLTFFFLNTNKFLKPGFSITTHQCNDNIPIAACPNTITLYDNI
mmetsp:Transcript_22421/g.33558  ORF Transcript_22421/g.33558 Transcript_22421/m.33558 type:complete len:103 (+) Transcript_22421:743-1051(+)